MNNKKIRVILVDDHQMVRETWRMILDKEEQIEVIAESSSGLEIIEQASVLEPDIILMDINMSPLNGFEATKKIARKHPQIKIIGVSINNQPAYAKKMIQFGAKGYLTKNTSKEEMVEAIIEVMNGNIFIGKEIREKQ